MSLYAIGDLHLHYRSILRAPGQLHDRVWKNHEERFQKNCGKTVTDKDTLVLVGDHSWGKSLAECELDFQFICDLLNPEKGGALATLTVKAILILFLITAIPDRSVRYYKLLVYGT